MDQEKLWRAEHYAPPPIKICMTHKEAALLYVVLCDNARTWNAELCDQLRVFVTDTDAFNARLELQPRLK
jgi:hypothetical protein